MHPDTATTSDCSAIAVQDSLIYTLSDGRTLGYAVYGVPLARPLASTSKSPAITSSELDMTSDAKPSTVLYCHGAPGCRLEAASLHGSALSANVRIISIDRPGIGLSSPISPVYSFDLKLWHPHHSSHSQSQWTFPSLQPMYFRRSRTILDFPADAASLLAHLGVQQYSILGYSAGAPYALACASSLPRQQVQGVAIVAGLAPWEIAVKTLSIHQRVLANIVAYLPSVAARLLEGSVGKAARKAHQAYTTGLKTDEARPFELIVSRSIATSDETSKKYLQSAPLGRVRFAANARETFRGSMDQLTHDLKLLVTHWGFEIEDVKIEERVIQMWYGGKDENVPLEQGRAMYEALTRKPGYKVDMHILDEETHFTILAKHGEHILRSLVTGTP